MTDTAAEFRAWLESLDDDRLVDFRFELYDRCAVAPKGSDTYKFARAALNLVYALERRRAFHRDLAMACVAAAPGTDGEAFAEALSALNRAQGELGTDDAAEVFAGALEVACRRGEAKPDEASTEGNT